jgi:DNA primase
MRIDAVQTIKDRLMMRDVLLRYGYEPKRRIKCPIHNGDGLNFEIKEHSFMCYSQCGGGDVITFVQKLFSLSFQEALKKIDVDFGLNLYGDKTFEELRKSHYQTKQLQAKREREKAEREQAQAKYWAVFDEWKRLDDNKRNYAPKTPDEELHPLFVEALQKLAHQEYLLECAEERRMRA